MPRLAFAVLPLALLAACGKSDSSEQSATGRVLEGTVSDAMLPVDTLTSEPPLAEPSDTGDNDGNSKSKSKGDKGAKPAAAGSAAAEPADTPTPETDREPPAATPAG